MVAFRKVLTVLALVVMMTAVASAANATFQCAANAGVPPLIRSEGLAEPVGDLTLNCMGGEDNAAPTFVNVQIFLSTNITSNILSGTKTEALLMIDDPMPAAQCLGATPNTPPSQAGISPSTECTANMWLGQTVSGSTNSIIWKGIPIVPPGSVGTRVIRVTNIRANATGVPSGSFVPGTITEYISITGSTTVPVSNQPQMVAFVQDSLDVTVSGTTGKQCTGPDGTATITFSEKFPSAFRKKIETDGELAAIDQSTPGLNYVTESIFTNEAGVPGLGKTGKANQGTRFIVKFRNVQTGVGISVPDRVESGSLYAVLVSGAAADGSTGTPVTTSGSTSVSLSSGAGFVVYEVVGTGNGVNGLVEDQSFAITASYSWTPNIGSGIPGLGDSFVSGNYGPISATTTMSAAAPEPRFKEKWVEGTALSISACRTILLFPYITNQIGFDTGIVISNTSSDPLSGYAKRYQQGACTLYYYGGVTGGGAAPAAQTSQVIPTGQQMTFTLSGGGTYGAPGAPGFQGYMFAICEFQFAHGYAFVTKMGATDIAHGYLALVVPDRTRLAQAFSKHAHVNDGEQLGY
jgi:hypothetical protein